MTTTSFASNIVGRIRVQVLGPHLVRIEQQGPAGFEDRETFTVLRTSAAPCARTVTSTNGRTIIATSTFRVSVPDDATSFEGVRIETPKGRLIRKLVAKDLQRSPMPSPSALPPVWIMADRPRVIPPPWGALPPPATNTLPHSGWDLSNDAPDLYVFFPAASGYTKFRSDFLHLTGPIPLPPLYAFGLWYSRYHPYSEDDSLGVINRFHKSDIPLDVFVVDTDWRVGASCGYEVNTNLFPDMKRFIQRVHVQGMRVMYNDHPEPVGQHAMDPKELQFRHTGLASLLDIGADIWWFDRNWHTHLQSPVEGLNKEVWGMRLYHDATQARHPQGRPLIMSNVDGINNGRFEYPSHPAAHRFPIWWTGDTVAEWDYLRLGVQNGVDSGIHSLLPYVNEDLTGHHGQPGSEFYTRFMQFGVFSPITRLHCTTKVTRYPWQYDEETERIVGNFIRLRYRLLPTIYAAAHQATVDGTPILRRCDLEWPQYPEASDNSQYLFGSDLLIAPILEPGDTNGIARRSVWIPEGEWIDLWTGRAINGPATVSVEAPIQRMPMWARRGGIVLSTPRTGCTTHNKWNEIILDAYVPSCDSLTVRELYEDDGSTTSYTNGIGGITKISLQRTGGQVTMNIDPSKEFHSFQVAKRTWIVRLHLPAGEMAEPVADASTTVLQPGCGPTDDLFAGPGSPPPSEDGLLVEFTIRDHTSSEPINLALEQATCTR